MAYAEVSDVETRLQRELDETEHAACEALLSDAAVLIDALAKTAAADAKKVVSCRMVMRALGDGSDAGVPVGASQGSMSALGYSQSWTMGTGATGELYVSKTDRTLLGLGNNIGSHSPLEALAPEVST